MGSKSKTVSISSEQIEIRKGGFISSLVGLPFFGAGIFVMLLGFRVIPIENASEVQSWIWFLLIFMGSVFTSVGAGVAFGRNSILIDKSSGELRKIWKLIVPMRSKVTSLHDFDRVMVRHSAGDSDSAESYPVVLSSSITNQYFYLSNDSEYADAFDQAGEVAEFLSFPMIDATTEHHTYYKPVAPRAGLRSRLHSVRQEQRYVTRPMDLKSIIERGNGELRIRIPRPGFNKLNLIPLAVLFLFAAFQYPAIIRFVKSAMFPPEIREFVFSTAAIFIGLIPLIFLILAVIRRIRGHTMITIDRDSLTIREREAFGSKKTVIPLGDVIDIDYRSLEKIPEKAYGMATSYERSNAYDSGDESGSRRRQLPAWVSYIVSLIRLSGITVKSRRGFYTVGKNLPDDEIRYLRSIILEKLSQ